MKTTFIKIPTFDKKYHYVRVEDILRFVGYNERESVIKSKVYLNNETVLNCTISEQDIFQLIIEL